MVVMFVGGWAILDLPPNFMHQITIILLALGALTLFNNFILQNHCRSNTAFSKLDSFIPTWSPILNPLFKAFYRSHTGLNTNF